MIVPEREPFLNFDSKTELPFEDKSKVFCSLVAFVKSKYSFDNALQDNAVSLLNNLHTGWFELDLTEQLIINFVPSPAGPSSGFLESILTLLSSPHSTIVAAALSLLFHTMSFSSQTTILPLVKSDLVLNVLTIVQPHTLPIAGNETIISKIIGIITDSLNFTSQSSVWRLCINTTVDKYNHREMIFQKVVTPSSQLMMFLISKRHVLNGDLFKSFMNLLSTLILIGPFHLPTLEAVLASPIVTTFSSCLTYAEGFCLYKNLNNIQLSLTEWKKEGQEVSQSGKRTIQVLISEGFEDTLEQTINHDKNGNLGVSILFYCRLVSQLLGSNVTEQ